MSDPAPIRFVEPPPMCLATLAQCRIRACRAKDAEAISRWMNDAELWRFVVDDKPPYVTTEHALGYLATQHDRPRSVSFGIASLEDDELIGMLHAQFGEFAYAYSAELSGWLGHPYRGAGIARQTTVAFTDWLFAERQALRVFAAPFHPNRASIGTLKASGFVFEGRHQAAAFKHGQVMDQMMYAKLAPVASTLPRAPARPPRPIAVETARHSGPSIESGWD